jgi:hypothetical protein
LSVGWELAHVVVWWRFWTRGRVVELDRSLEMRIFGKESVWY